MNSKPSEKSAYFILILPLAATLPLRPIRLAGSIGYIEIALLLLSFITFSRFTIDRKTISLDKFLVLMTVIALGVALSFISQRASPDANRLITWLGAMLVYFITFNLTIHATDIRLLLYLAAFIVISFVAFDLISHAAQYDLTNVYERQLFRSEGTSIGVSEDAELGGQANYTANIAFLFLPIILSSAIFYRGIYRAISTLLLAICIGLAILVASRSFFLLLFVCGLGLVSSLKIPKRKVISSSIILVLVFLVITHVYSDISTYTFDRLSETTQGDSRLDIWRDTYQASLDRIIFGHGAIGGSIMVDRYGTAGEHNLFLQVFFEYGVFMASTSVALFFLWYKQTKMLVNLAQISPGNTQLMTATSSYLTMLNVFTYSMLTPAPFFLTTYASLTFMLLALSSAQKYQYQLDNNGKKTTIKDAIWSINVGKLL